MIREIEQSKGADYKDTLDKNVSKQASDSEITVFDKIVRREIPAKIVFEDDLCLAFRDIFPTAPTHILIIPKHRAGLTQLCKAEERHKELLGHLLLTVAKVAKQEGLAERGYRTVINDGKEGCQSVYHLHIHVIGGQQLGWPPGVKLEVLNLITYIFNVITIKFCCKKKKD